MKEKTDKLDFIKIINYWSAKDTVKKIKRHATDWEKTFAKHISEKELISKKHKEHLNQKKKKLKNRQETRMDTSPKKIHR